MTVYGDKFPPKNRTNRTDLGVIDIEISGQGTTLVFDPNGLIIALIRDELFPQLGEPISDNKGSVLSGQPGYRYCDSEVDMVLERSELDRFIRHDLMPEEYFKLRDTYGLFFMIHDDFYYEDTGEAVQPAKVVVAPPELR